MPTYCFECPKCGQLEELVRPMADSGYPAACPICHETMHRDLQAERPNAQNDFTREVHSEALGIHPSQIEEATRKFPHHKYLSDGRMVIRSTQERNRIARDLGYDPG